MRKLTVLFLSLLLLTAAKFPSKIKLVYSPEQGTYSKYELKVKSVLTMNNAGLSALNLKMPGYTNHLYFMFTDRIDSVDESGVITETITYDDFRLEQEIMGVKTPLDADFDLKGKSFTTTVTSDGKLKDTKGLDILAPALKNLKLDNMFLQIRPAFPEEEIKIGATWENETETKLPIKTSIVRTSMKTRYSLDGFEKIDKRNCAVVGISLEIKTETIPVQREKEDFVIEVNLSGTGKGKIYYDYRQSKIISSNITMSLENKISTISPLGISNLDTNQAIEMDLKLTKEGRKKNE